MNHLTNNLLKILWWVLLLSTFVLWLKFFLSNTNNPIDTPQSIILHSNNSEQPMKMEKISGFHLFGSSIITQANIGENSQETSLNLSVTGILASTDPQSGSAYISNNQGDEKKFSVGESVYELATLESVYEDHLILSRSNKQEKLSLQKNKIKTSPKKQYDSTKHQSAIQRINSHIKTGGKNWQETIDQQRLDPQKIAQIAKQIIPLQDSQGRISGLRVSALASNSTLLKQGLRSYDQIVAINGINVSSANMMNIASQLENSQSTQITVLRNGQKVKLQVNLNEIKK